MAAGLGFKNFSSGEVLTAADVNGYLMQGVGVFTNAANRDAEITSPQEGQFAYLKDTNVTTYYTGSAWANLDTTGMTNPMTTTGDVIYSSSGSTPARLGIGTAGQVLQVNSGATAPEWATAGGAGANWSLLNAGGTALTGATTVTVSGISGKDKIMILVQGASSASSNIDINWRVNGDTASNYYRYGIQLNSPSAYSSDSLDSYGGSTDRVRLGTMGTNAGAAVSGYVLLSGCNSSGVKTFQSAGAGTPGGGSNQVMYHFGGYYDSATAISSISIVSNSGNLDAGTVFVYTSA
jgi:hypothetical protein